MPRSAQRARPQSRRAPRGRDGAGRGPESAPGRQAAKKQVAPRFSRSEKARGELPAARSAFLGHFLGEMEARGAFIAPKAPK